MFDRIRAARTTVDAERLKSQAAELQAVLADAGARDIADPGVRMPRLVIVVDEFASLVEHLEAAGVQTTGARPVELVVGASLDDHDVVLLREFSERIGGRAGN